MTYPDTNCNHHTNEYPFCHWCGEPTPYRGHLNGLLEWVGTNIADMKKRSTHHKTIEIWEKRYDALTEIMARDRKGRL